MYAQLPYQEGQAEKSAVQLIGFGKTGELSAGESEEVKVTIDEYLFATYDVNAVNGADTSKKGSYVFDPGDYYFAIGNDSHDALNNILAKKDGTKVQGKLISADGSSVDGAPDKVISVPLESLDNVTYAKSEYTDEIVSNQFDDVDLNYFGKNTVTYLTRNDWNTYPEPYSDLTATDELKAVMYDQKYEKPADAPAYDSFTQGAEVTLKLLDMKDVPFEDDVTWNKFLDQLTISELSATIGENFGQPAVKSINKPANKNTDGPSGSHSSYLYGGNRLATAHVSQIVAASIWNQELLAERGNFIAEDCLFSGTTQLWSPGANMHRTPFSGRNFEYYSEDSIVSYLMGANQARAMQAKGLTAAIKHFVSNDQETNRSELATFMSEQAYRQGPLKAFGGAFTGYTQIIEKMLSSERIDVELNQDFFKHKESYLKEYPKVVYTGMIDQLFDYRFGELDYRSLRFESCILDQENYQGNAVVNYTDAETPHTRIIEHKHFEFGSQPKTIITKEYPKTWEQGDEPYYPLNDDTNNEKYRKYSELAGQLPNILLGGRLGMYKYFDMHQVIAAALSVVKAEFNSVEFEITT